MKPSRLLYSLAGGFAPLVLLTACSAGGSGGSSGAGGAGQGGAGSASSGLGGGSAQATSSVSSAGSGSGSGAGGGGVKDCKSLPLCDDFEGQTAGGPPDASKWTVVSPDCMGTGSLAVDGSVAHSGTSSLKVTGKGGFCNHVFFSNTSVIGTLGKVIYARFYLRLTDPLGDGHVTFLAMKDTNDGGKHLRMGGQGKAMMYNRESDDATLPAIDMAGLAKSVQPATLKWTCVELMVDENTGFIDTWVDGTEVAGLHEDGLPTQDVDQQWLTGKPSWKPSLSDFALGWESYSGQDMTLWFDDVALSSARIGCD